MFLFDIKKCREDIVNVLDIYVSKINSWLLALPDLLGYFRSVLNEERRARPIKETPILFGEDARRFEERMKEKRRETPEQRAKRLKDYELAMKIF